MGDLPWLSFFIGAASSMIICFTQPSDLVKNRMQVMGPLGRKMDTLTMISEIYKAEGVIGFYKGLTAALCRQGIDTAGRMTLFYSSLEIYYRNYDVVASFPVKLLLGITAGGIGAVLGNPADVALVRMTCDGWRPEGERRNYRNVVDAIRRISREEGVKALYKGVYPAAFRAMIVNGAQLGTYAQAREQLFDNKQAVFQRYLMASMISGFVTTVVSLPIDTVKTRVQNSTERVTVKGVIAKLIEKEGVLSLWKGFWPSYLVIAPYTVVTFLLLEEFNSVYFKFMDDVHERHKNEEEKARKRKIKTVF